MFYDEDSKELAKITTVESNVVKNKLLGTLFLVE